MTNSKRRKLLLSVASIFAAFTIGFTGCGQPVDSGSDSGSSGGKDPVIENPSYLEEGVAESTSSVSGFVEKGGKFYSDYETLDDAHEAGQRLNVRVAEEGIVLLKNENDALPLTKDERNVSLFGIKSVDIQTGGGGSGSGYAGRYGIEAATLESSMEEAGFSVNKKLLTLYRQNLSAMSYSVSTAGGDQTLTLELPLSYYSNLVTRTYGSYNDAAIITFARTGAEGYDLLMHDVPGHSDTSEHVLTLSDAEKDLIKHAKANFDKVIVLINSSNIMEVGELNAPKTKDNLGVDAILHIGHVGNDGATAIGRILNGSVNPSGHTVDIWSKDFTKDPSWTNFGDQVQNGLDNYLYLNGEDTGFRSVEYREDIYNGYRFYETVATDMDAKTAGSGESWYQENVVYPFGYGLSYTTFDWEICKDIAPNAKITAANQTITVKIKVTNTGLVAGKDVVQIYASQPYTKGGIEKASRVLVGFEKTKLLQPGQSQTVTIKFAAQDMASFDWNDKNENGFVGYELEAGAYVITANSNSHDVKASITRTVEKTITCATDLDTGNEIVAAFSQTEGELADYNSTNDALVNNLLSRANEMTQPASSTKEDRSVSQAFVDMMEGGKNYKAYQDDEDDPWYVSQVPSTWKQATSHAEGYTDVTVKIADMAGITFSDPTVVDGKAVAATDEGSKKWDEFMNQLTWEELCQICSQGSYGRPSVASISKPLEVDIDGPAQLAWYGSVQLNSYYPDEDHDEYCNGVGTLWVTAVVIASTWNVDLAEEVGLMVGNEGILTNTSGWYGPSLNIHRSPLGGRNFEYYSEDPVVSGEMAGAMVLGATSKGLVCYAKHMFLNEQETNRDTKRGICTYATEQAIREIYLKPFEYVIKTGRSLGTMAASNRIGSWVAFGNHALDNVILRDEWNFCGINLTDSTSGNRALAYASINHLIRNGVDLPLGVGSPIDGHKTYGKNDCEYYLEEGVWNAEENMVYVASSETDIGYTLASPTQYYNVRKAAQHVLYASANSNGINNGVKNADVKVTVKALKTLNESIATVDLIGTDSVANAKIVDGALPSGVSLTDTGVLTGSTSSVGVYDFKVEMQGDGWVKTTVSVKLVVESAIKYSGTDLTSVTEGSAVNGKFESDSVAIGDTVSGAIMGGAMTVSAEVKSVSFSAAGLPEGLTIAEDGTITGSVATAGTYEVVVTMTAKAPYSLYYGYLKGDLVVTFSYTYTITVA